MRLAAFLFLCIGLLPHSGWAETAADGDILTGHWSGSYSCGNLRDAQFTLTTEQGANGVINGNFAFDGSIGKGAYQVQGRVADGRIRLQPRDWIERPPGVDAVGMELRTRDDGAVIEGEIQGCGLNGKLLGASAERMAQRQSVVNAGPMPPSMTGLAGHWQGEITCRGPRKSSVIHPVQAMLLTDQDRVAADVRIDQPMGQQRVIMRGAARADRLDLQMRGMLAPGQRPALRELSLTGDARRLTGTVMMNNCSAISLTRQGDATAPALPEALLGSWTGSAGLNEAAALRLESRNGPGGGFAELWVSQPANLPLEQRSKGQVVMVAAGQMNGWTLMLPLPPRSYEQAMRDQPKTLALLTYAWGLLVAPDRDGSLRALPLVKGNNPERLVQLLAGTPVPQGLLAVGLSHADSATTEALREGESPPVTFPTAIVGPLASAPSREAQCAVLQDWIGPYAAGKDMEHTSIDRLQHEMADAFADSRFEPVFGLPLGLLSAEERKALRRFMSETCDRGLGMKDVGFAGSFVIGHEAGYQNMVRFLADVAESGRWVDATMGELPTLASSPASIDRIAALRAERKRRGAELSSTRIAVLDGALDLRARQIRTDILRADIDRTLSELADGRGQGDALLRLFKLAARVSNDDILPEAERELRDRLAGTAGPIATAEVDRLTAEGAALPASVQGLSGAQRIWVALGPVLDGMSTHFRQSLYPRIAAFAQREQAILDDPAVLAGFRQVLEEVPTTRGMAAAVRRTALTFVTEETLKQRLEYAAAVEEAVLSGELRAVRITDSGIVSDPGEPSARDIAGFLLGRVQGVNEQVAQMEAACLQGPEALGNNVIKAIECLTLPAVWTGQKGFGVELLSAHKVSCRPRDGGYYCMFKQEIAFFGPGGTPMDMSDFIGNFGAAAASLEVQDALFIPAGDKWQVVWGDLQ